MTRQRVAIIFLQTLWVYTLAGWIYVAVAAAFTPHLLSHRVVDWIDLRKDTFGIVCFACSAVSYFFLQLVEAAPRLFRS